MKSLVLFPYTVVLMNWAAVMGLVHFLRGQHDAWSGCDVVASLPAQQGAPIKKKEFSDAA